MPGRSVSAGFCDRDRALTPGQQDKLLRFAGVLREELAALPGDSALISRSGLDLAHFQIRYSYAAVAWRNHAGVWAARQLYYACNERRPRIYDQGVAGFAMGGDDPAAGYMSIVTLPHAAAASPAGRALQRQCLSLQPALSELQSLVVELMASAWDGLADGADLRARSQDWLQQAGYAPQPVAVGSRALTLASVFVPFIHMDDHPGAAMRAMQLPVSLPSTLESFVRQRQPGAERIEFCHNGRQVVVHRGWTPVADGCRAGPDDRVVALD